MYLREQEGINTCPAYRAFLTVKKARWQMRSRACMTGFVARIAQRDLTRVELICHGLDIINPGSQR
jgi:hypothetical protein